ncbi:hypothetical protein HID58_095285 [Brassica napus]|uniref:RING-type domain-containing protein n=1 Tax=Brassica napus TaxID=3708 RepID=A0ABQ7X6K8_BRANA|nr:hypothetical protein HID58_095285 [Brassica napus]
MGRQQRRRAASMRNSCCSVRRRYAAAYHIANRSFIARQPQDAAFGRCRLPPVHASTKRTRVDAKMLTLPLPPWAAASASVTSGLANLAVLADQLKLNRLFSYSYVDNAASDCIVCLSTLKTGEEVRRKLDCRHVSINTVWKVGYNILIFNCPLCRSTRCLPMAMEKVDRALKPLLP